MSNEEHLAAADIVRRAYRNVLGREPDREALLHYQKIAISIAQTEELLIKSREYKLNIVKKNDLKWPLSQIFIVQKHKIIYCPIGKNANSSLKRLMVQLSDIPLKAEILDGDVHWITDTRNTGIQLSDLDNAAIKNIITDKIYFKFAVFRDPVDRILSAYWEKFVVNRSASGNIRHTVPVICAIQSCSIDSIDPELGITFKSFIEFLTKEDPRRLDTHWKPQYLYLEGIKYDRIFDFGNLTPLYTKIREITNLEINPIQENITRSGLGNYVGGAHDMFPACLEKYETISRESFLNDQITKLIECYYGIDYAVYDNIRDKN